MNKRYIHIVMPIWIQNEEMRHRTSEPVLEEIRLNAWRNLIEIYENESFSVPINQMFPHKHMIASLDNQFSVTLYLQREHIRMKAIFNRFELELYPIIDTEIQDITPYAQLAIRLVENLYFSSFKTRLVGESD